jgi:hypothetical protein
MKVNPSLPESIENLLHHHLPPKALLIFNKCVKDPNGQLVKEELDPEMNEMLAVPRLERFIGVVYRVCPFSSTFNATVIACNGTLESLLCFSTV